MEGVVSRAVRISIDFQSTLATLERLGDAEIRVPGTTVTARLGRTRLKGAIGDDDFTAPKHTRRVRGGTVHGLQPAKDVQRGRSVAALVHETKFKYKEGCGVLQRRSHRVSLCVRGGVSRENTGIQRRCMVMDAEKGVLEEL